MRSLVFIFFCVLLTKNSIGQEIPLRNTLDVPVTVYFKTKFSDKWNPPLKVKRKDTVSFSPKTTGKYYILFQVENAQLDLGWVDVNYVVTEIQKEQKQLRLEGKTTEEDLALLVGTRTVSIPYTVQVPYQETRAESYTVKVPYTDSVTQTYQVTLPNGQVETKTRQVPVTKYRTETKNRYVPVTKYRMETKNRNEIRTGLLLKRGNSIRSVNELEKELRSKTRVPK